jgi:hypothetical protein
MRLILFLRNKDSKFFASATTQIYNFESTSPVPDRSLWISGQEHVLKKVRRFWK